MRLAETAFAALVSPPRFSREEFDDSSGKKPVQSLDWAAISGPARGFRPIVQRGDVFVRFLKRALVFVGVAVASTITALAPAPAGACVAYDTGLESGPTCEPIVIRVPDNCAPTNNPPLEGCVP